MGNLTTTVLHPDELPIKAAPLQAGLLSKAYKHLQTHPLYFQPFFFSQILQMLFLFEEGALIPKPWFQNQPASRQVDQTSQ